MARTFKNLYPRIYDFDNLWLAWRNARRGGKRRWPTVAAFEVDPRRPSCRWPKVSDRGQSQRQSESNSLQAQGGSVL